MFVVKPSAARALLSAPKPITSTSSRVPEVSVLHKQLPYKVPSAPKSFPLQLHPPSSQIPVQLFRMAGRGQMMGIRTWRITFGLRCDSQTSVSLVFLLSWSFLSGSVWIINRLMGPTLFLSIISSHILRRSGFYVLFLASIASNGLHSRRGKWETRPFGR